MDVQAIAVSNANAEVAAAWLMDHSGDADINDPPGEVKVACLAALSTYDTHTHTVAPPACDQEVALAVALVVPQEQIPRWWPAWWPCLASLRPTRPALWRRQVAPWTVRPTGH